VGAREAAVGAAAALAVLGGCGGGGKVPDPDAARSAVSHFAKAFGGGDGKAACDLLTKAAQAAFVKRVQVLAATKDCPAAMAKVHAAAGADVNAALSAATVSNVKVAGATATATLTASGHSTSVNLAKQDGVWELTGVPGI
jgi:hypothetical protein